MTTKANGKLRNGASAASSPPPTDVERVEKGRLASLALDPSASGVATLLAFSKGTFGEGDAQSLYEATSAEVRAVRAGSMAGPEALLVSQANSLNMIFTELARRSGLNMGEYIEASERYMRLALKAQAQCRATIETLAALKNPPIVYARQANIAAGHQQINNHPPASAASPAEDREGAQNKLLEAVDVEEHRLDAGTKGPSEPGDSQLEPLDAVHRTPHRLRQKPVES